MRNILGKIWKFVKKVSLPDAIFVTAILIIITIPNIMLNKKQYELVEKRPLAKMPKLIVNGKINKEFGKQFENFYNDNFWQRNTCIDKNLAIKGFINGRMEGYLEIEGQNGCLFYKGDDSVSNYKNKVLFSDMELLRIKHNLDILNVWCNKNGIKLIVVIPPDKNRVYGEYFPKHIKKVNPKSRVELLREYMSKNSDIEIIYPIEQMYARKKHDSEPLYYYTDTHWTPVGAYVAYNEIIKQINKSYPYVKTLDYHKLDSTRMTFKERFGRNGDGADNLKTDDYDIKYLFYKDSKNYNPAKYDLKVAIIGDSFSGELLFWMGKGFDVNRYLYNEKVELFVDFSMKLWEDKVLSYNPDILIVEFVERYAYKLLDLYKD